MIAQRLQRLTRVTARQGPCESRQICRGHPLSLHNLYCKFITRKCLILKIKVKVMEHNVRNGVIRWQISQCINVITHFYASSHRFEILTFKMLVAEYNIRSDTIGWRIPTSVNALARVFTLVLPV